MSNETSKPTPNDQRSDVKNPNNPAHQDARDNESRQANPQDPKHQPGQQRQPPGPGQREG
ncbi:MAG: hypothetical protein ABI134_25865 [Byssovorax sp.]